MAKSTDEKIADLQKQIEQLKNQEKALKAKQKVEARKKDAHRKIVNGGMLDAMLGHPVEPDEAQAVMDFLKDQDRRGNYFAKWMEKFRERKAAAAVAKEASKADESPDKKETKKSGFRRSTDQSSFGSRKDQTATTQTEDASDPVLETEDFIDTDLMLAAAQAERIEFAPEDRNYKATPRMDPGEEYTAGWE